VDSAALCLSGTETKSEELVLFELQHLSSAECDFDTCNVGLVIENSSVYSIEQQRMETDPVSEMCSAQNTGW